MTDSVLVTIKKMLGLDESYNAFDTDIIVFINSVIMTLQQLGVTDKQGVTITGPTETWADVLPSDKLVEGAKSYIYLKVKLLFDPPSNSFVLNSYEKQIEELEYRMKEQMEAYPGSIADDPKEPEDDESDFYDPWAEGDL